MQMKKKYTVIGAAILDILAGPVDQTVFTTGSCPMDFTRLSFGGDALNEAVVLSRLGEDVDLISLVGADEAGKRVLSFAQENGIRTEHIQQRQGLETGVNIVLVDGEGERHFLTNPHSSLRKLSVEDILPFTDEMGDIVSFASIFVSPALDIPSMERLFRSIRQKPGRILAADFTKAKNGETLQDIAPLLHCIDYALPNESELALLTGKEDPAENVRRMLECGASCVILKQGKKGCLVGLNSREIIPVRAYPTDHAVDSTGAGDSFAAGFLWGLSHLPSPLEAARFGCAVASCAVEGIGAAGNILSLEEPLRRYHLL